MQRAVTAIYPSHATATLVRQELEQLGLGRHHVTILPDIDVTSRSDRSAVDVEDSLDRLHALGLPAEDARTYQQALRNGDYVVSVSVDDDADLMRIQEIMRRPEDAYDLDELDTRYGAAEYIPPAGTAGTAGLQMAAGMGAADRTDYGTQQQGYAGSGSMAQSGGMGTADYAAGTRYNEDGTVKVIEEDIAVGKREVERGAVRVHSYVREEPVSADVDLRRTRVFVERRPVDRPLSPGEVGLPEQVLEAHEMAEEAVVAKTARVVEEVRVGKEVREREETIEDTVRRKDVDVERVSANDRNQRAVAADSKTVINKDKPRL